MRELFLSECRRFRNAAAIAALVHAALLFLLCRTMEPLQMGWREQLVMLCCHAAAGLAFGLYQFGSWRQPNRWIWLMHRPLPQWRIAAALGAASVVLLFAAIGLPLLGATALLRALTTRVVDSHHVAVVLYAFVFSVIAWLCGAYVMLSRSRLAIAVAVLPCVLLLRMANAWTMLAVAVCCAMLLAAVVLYAVKPNRAAPVRRIGAVITALPLLVAFYCALVFGGSMLYQSGLIVAGMHPLNGDRAPAGGVAEAQRAQPVDLLRLGLAASSDPRAPQWRRQVALLDVQRLTPMLDRYPVRHPLAHETLVTFHDPATATDWTFSHDSLAYAGRDRYSGAARDARDPIGAPFAAPPVQLGAAAVLPQQVRVLENDPSGWRTVLTMRADETLLSLPDLPFRRPGLHYALTDKRLIALARIDDDLVERYSVPLPGPAADLARVDIAPLLDGALVSFTFGAHMIDGVAGGAQIVLAVDAAGRAAEVARRPLSHDYAVLLEHRGWWVSPALNAMAALPDRLLDDGTVLRIGTLPRPPVAVLAALVAALVSALASWAWLRGSAASPRTRIAWTAAGLLLGPPALLTLAMLEPRPARLPAALPAMPLPA